MAAVAALTPGTAAQAARQLPASQPGSQPGSRPGAQSIVVRNLSSSGPGSLRAAIRGADTTSPGTATVISFSVHGIIRLTTALPPVSGRVTIDGTSAPGYQPGGPPVVEIDCRRHPGLVFSAGSAGAQLLGIAIDDASGNGVTLKAGFITINDDYVGVNLAGRALGNDGDGIYVSPTSARNMIGLNRSGDSGTVANVISGNRGNGLTLAGSSGNIVAANRIGTNATGTAAIGNGGNGILITGRSDRNEIGGTAFTDAATGQVNNPTGSKGTVTPVFVVPPLGNLISGNAGNGLLIDRRSAGNVLNGNFIGTTADGDGAIGNAGNGVWINQADRNQLIGCKFINNPFVYYNVLSGNGANGLRITSSSKTVVQGNFFGVAANNTTTVPNRRDGIRVDGTSANTQVGGVIPLGNVSAGNRMNGVEVAGRARGFTTFNTFGGLLAFKGAAPNGNDGLLITSAGGNNLARTNVFSGNKRNGIELAGNASGVTIDPDIAGLTTNGQGALPNGSNGVLIDGNAHDNIIGGSLRSVIAQDTFSANLGYGLAIVGRAHDNHVFTDFIGTAILGVKRLGNHRGGILIGGDAYRNVIGAAGSRPANLISGNSGIGVTLQRGTRGNFVINNYIGLDRFGRYLPNSGPAVVNRGSRNTIRGNRYRPGRKLRPTGASRRGDAGQAFGIR